MPSPVLDLHSVSRSYRAGIRGCSAEVTAVDAVSLQVAPGECVGITGGPGAGKTTLLLLAAGLLTPDSGTVRAVRAAYVPAHGVAHLFLGVRASLDFAASLVSVESCGVEPDLDDVLARCGLSELAMVRIGALTPGMRARVALAHALLCSPRLLLLDEPLAPLDNAQRRRYAALIVGLRRDGIGVVLAERDAALLRAFAARIITLAEGRVAVEPAPPLLLELEVGMPHQAAAVLSALLPFVVRRGRSLRVPLERVSAEEVLSACRDAGICVHGSRVISGWPSGGSRVAENDP